MICIIQHHFKLRRSLFVTTSEAIDTIFKACLDFSIGVNRDYLINSLTPDDFVSEEFDYETNELNRHRFKSIKSVYNEQGDINPILLYKSDNSFRSDPILNLCEGDYLPTMIRATIDDAIAKLKQNGLNRKKKSFIHSLSADKETVEELIEKVTLFKANLKNELVSHEIESSFKTPALFFEKEEPGLKTGYTGIDNKTGLNGLKGFTIIGGTPKSYKSTLTFNIAYNISQGISYTNDGVKYKENPVPVLYIDFENGLKRLVRRKLAEYLQIEYYKTYEALIPIDLRQDYYDFLERLQTNEHFYNKEFQNLVISKEKLDLTNIKRFLNSIREKHKSDRALLVIDSFQKLPLPSITDRRAGIDLWLRELENLKKQENIDILAVSELSRKGQEEISSTSFKESGDIEYTAENLLALYRIPESKLNNNHKAVLSLDCLLTRDNDPVNKHLSFFNVGSYFNLDEVSYLNNKSAFQEYDNALNGNNPVLNNGNGKGIPSNNDLQSMIGNNIQK